MSEVRLVVFKLPFIRLLRLSDIQLRRSKSKRVFISFVVF